MTEKQWQKLDGADKQDKFLAICESSSSKERLLFICGLDWVIAAYRWYLNEHILIEFFQQLKEY